MLECHLNPTWDAASRLADFIDASVEWISKIVPVESHKSLLDLGCGPGLYAERLFNKGYLVTGVDFSKRSIDYACGEAKKRDYKINYMYQNYLDIEYSNEFDVVLLIYCDYGVLSNKERKILLEKIYNAMKEGGKFIFDVFTPNKYKDKKEETNWYFTEGAGFWKPDAHLCLEAHYIYEGNIRLDQHVIIDKDGNVDVFKCWDHYFTKETIVEEIKKAGFKNIQIYSDVSGKLFDEKSIAMGIVAEK